MKKKIIKKKIKNFEILNFVSGFSFSMKEIAQIVSFEASKILKKILKLNIIQKAKIRKIFLKFFLKLNYIKKKKIYYQS